VVEEGVVLLGVEHFEQRADGSPGSHRHLVDLVEQEHRVLRAASSSSG